MPDWHQSAADVFDRIDWQQIAEPGKAFESTPHATESQEA